MEIKSAQEMNLNCIEAYGKPLKNCRGIVYDHEDHYGDTPNLLFYPVADNGQHVPPMQITSDKIYNKGSETEQSMMQLIKYVIKKEGLKDYGDMDFDEQKFLHSRLELEKLIALMK